MKDSGILKSEMMELWKQTFHDSDRYIRLVFDSYFSPENVFYHYEGKLLVAAMLTVPYDFILPFRDRKVLMKGLYLCGLATRPEYRKKGIMSDLMDKAEIYAKQRGYDMTFLIPADSKLREFYQKKGYTNTAFRIVSNIYPKTILNNNTFCLNIYSIQELYKNGNTELIKRLAKMCHDEEKDSQVPSIIHSVKDMEVVMAENEDSFFLTEATFDLKYPILTKVVSVVFPDCSEEQEQVKIAGMYCFKNYIHENFDKNRKTEDLEDKIEASIDASLFRKFPDAKLIRSIKPYEGNVEDNGGLELIPYAMAKKLHQDPSGKESTQSMTFRISLMLD